MYVGYFFVLYMEKKRKRKGFLKFHEVVTRVIEYVKTDDIYINGADNLYPNTVQNVLYQSNTASLAIRALSDFISGKGVENDFIVNKKGQYLSELIADISTDIAVQNGFWLHVSYELDYNLKYKPINPILLPYLDCRKSKEDDADNDGKIYVSDWSNSSNNFFLNIFKKDKTDWYYPFNPKQEIVHAQVLADGGIEKYRGQVMYVNLTPHFEYALSLFNAVINDADSENRVGMYTNAQLRGGFMGKTLAVTNGLDESFEDVVYEWIGAEGASGVAVVNLEKTEDIKDAIHLIQVKSQYDEKQFSETKQALRENILGAAKNLPKQLVIDGGGIFSQSGEAIQQLKQFYNEQTKNERNAIEKAFKKIGIECKIIPLV